MGIGPPLVPSLCLYLCLSLSNPPPLILSRLTTSSHSQRGQSDRSTFMLRLFPRDMLPPVGSAICRRLSTAFSPIFPTPLPSRRSILPPLLAFFFTPSDKFLCKFVNENFQVRYFFYESVVDRYF